MGKEQKSGEHGDAVRARIRPPREGEQDSSAKTPPPLRLGEQEGRIDPEVWNGTSAYSASSSRMPRRTPSAADDARAREDAPAFRPFAGSGAARAKPAPLRDVPSPAQLTPEKGTRPETSSETARPTSRTTGVPAGWTGSPATAAERTQRKAKPLFGEGASGNAALPASAIGRPVIEKEDIGLAGRPGTKGRGMIEEGDVGTLAQGGAEWHEGAKSWGDPLDDKGPAAWAQEGPAQAAWGKPVEQDQPQDTGVSLPGKGTAVVTGADLGVPQSSAPAGHGISVVGQTGMVGEGHPAGYGPGLVGEWGLIGGGKAKKKKDKTKQAREPPVSQRVYPSVQARVDTDANTSGSTQSSPWSGRVPQDRPAFWTREHLVAGRDPEASGPPALELSTVYEKKDTAGALPQQPVAGRDARLAPSLNLGGEQVRASADEQRKRDEEVVVDVQGLEAAAPAAMASGVGVPPGGRGRLPTAESAADGEGETPIVVILLQDITARIQNGELVAGTQLVPAEALAKQVGVSRALILQVYRALEAEGWIERRGILGSFVNWEKREIDSPMARVTRWLREQILNGNIPFGTRLLPMRKLAMQQGFDETTAQIIYLILESEGLLVKKMGRRGGIFVKEVNTGRFSTEIIGRSKVVDALSGQTNREFVKPPVNNEFLRRLEVDSRLNLTSRVPSEVREAGAIMAEHRGDIIDRSEIAKALGISWYRYRSFEQGLGFLELDEICRVAEDFYPWSFEMLEKLDQLRRDFNILRILAQPSMTGERASNLLRLSSGLTQEVFAGQAGDINRSTVRDSVTGRKKTLAYTENQMLKAANVSEQSKATQLYHLVNSGVAVFWLREFIDKLPQERLLYYRKAMGLTMRMEAELTGHEYWDIYRYESGKRKIPAQFLEMLVGTGVLYKVMLPRKPGEKIELTDEEIKILFQEEALLFGEHLIQATKYSYRLPTEGDTIYQRIKRMQQIGEIFATVRGNLGYTEVQQRGGGERGNLREIESGKKKPEDRTIVQFCTSLGYGFFHPITQEMLYRNWLTRKGRDSL